MGENTATVSSQRKSGIVQKECCDYALHIQLLLLGQMWLFGFCLPLFALARRGMVPQVRDILPCCQIPFAPSSCAAAATHCLLGSSGLAVLESQQLCSLPVCAAGTARLSVLGAAVGPSSSAGEQLPGSLQQVPGEQLLPDGEGSCSPGVWR